MNFSSTVDTVPILSKDDVDNVEIDKIVQQTSNALNSKIDFSGGNTLITSPSLLNELIDEVSRSRKTLSRMGAEVVTREALIVNRKMEAYKERCARRKTMQLSRKNASTCIASSTKTDKSSCASDSKSSGFNSDVETIKVADSVFASLSSSTASVNCDNSDKFNTNEEDDDVLYKGTYVAATIDFVETAVDVSLASIHAERITIMDQAYRMNRMSMLLRLINQTHSQFLEELLECQKCSNEQLTKDVR